MQGFSGVSLGLTQFKCSILRDISKFTAESEQLRPIHICSVRCSIALEVVSLGIII